MTKIVINSLEIVHIKEDNGMAFARACIFQHIFGGLLKGKLVINACEPVDACLGIQL